MTKKLCLTAMYAAVAIVIFVAEAQLPPLTPLPWIKLGLANIVTVVAMLRIGKKEAAAVVLVRVLLGNLFTGQPISMIYSLAGAIPAFAVTVGMLWLVGKERLWAVSAAAAIFHSLGQLLAASVMSGSFGVMLYAPLMTAASVVSGVFTGLAAQSYIKHTQRR